jgi:hypothetical protein
MGESAVSGAGAAPSGMPPARPGILPYQHRDERQGGDRVSIQDTGPRRVDLGEAARQLQLAAHDAQVAFDCMGLGELDRAHTHAITARAAADAAENLLRAALADGAADQA